MVSAPISFLYSGDLFGVSGKRALCQRNQDGLTLAAVGEAAFRTPHPDLSARFDESLEAFVARIDPAQCRVKPHLG